jgi:hypothetical protein
MIMKWGPMRGQRGVMALVIFFTLGATEQRVGRNRRKRERWVAQAENA